MLKYFCIGTALITVAFLHVINAFPQGEGGGSGQDPCAQYQAQCVNGSSLVGQGASSGIAAFPNNPIPVNQLNMTAVKQMPYCEAMAQACRAQGNSPPTAPPVPSPPSIPAAPGGGGFFSSLKSLFSF